MTLKAIKTIKSHTGHAQFLATLKQDETGCAKVIRWIPRQPNIPSPYSHSLEWPVYSLDGQEVVIRETSHKKFQVFAVYNTNEITVIDETQDMNESQIEFLKKL